MPYKPEGFARRSQHKMEMVFMSWFAQEYYDQFIPYMIECGCTSIVPTEAYYKKSLDLESIKELGSEEEVTTMLRNFVAYERLKVRRSLFSRKLTKVFPTYNLTKAIDWDEYKPDDLKELVSRSTTVYRG